MSFIKYGFVALALLVVAGCGTSMIGESPQSETKVVCCCQGDCECADCQCTCSGDTCSCENCCCTGAADCDCAKKEG